MKFEHLGGGVHSHNDGRDYKKGDLLTTGVDMAKQFPGKWKRVDLVPAPEPEPEGGKKTPPDAQAASEEKKGVKISKGGKKAPQDARGVEVTEEVEGLEDGYKVFQRGELFHVYEGDSLEPINKKALGKASEAVKVVKKFLEE